MGTITGTYIDKVETGNERIDTLVNVLLPPTLEKYEQIIINYETATLLPGGVCRFTYQNWNRAYPVEVYLNGGVTPVSPSLYDIDYEMGRIAFKEALADGDAVMATYCFNYFPYHILEGFIHRAVVVLNTAGNGTVTAYTVKTIPEGWLGIVADIVVSMCMEKLILEYDLWKGRLIFAISNNGIYEGNDNIVGQLETVKKNAEERAYKSLDNAKLRAGEHLAKPTEHYYEALLVGSSARYKNGTYTYGPLRGAKFNKLFGNIPRK